MSAEIFIILLLVVIIFSLLTAYITYKKDCEKHIWVHIKTGNLYWISYIGKLKDPTTREWVEAVFYEPVKEHKIYARERKDFTLHFMRHKEWKKKMKG